MKIQLDIDTTPQELRTFFGLPDVEPLQREMLEQIRKQMEQGVAGFDPMGLMKPFLPENLQSLQAMQKQFWESMARAAKREKTEE